MSTARHTISDVAAAASVSISTVSLVMNGKGPVADATRRRVLAVADRMGYAPSRSARGLAARRTGNVGFVLREDHFRQSEPFYTRVFLGAEFEARRRGLYVLLSTVPDPYLPGEHAPRFLKEHSVDGVVVAGGVDGALIEQLRDRSIPHVLADFAWGDAPQVSIDNHGGAVAVARHLVERGHERAAFLGADPEHPSPVGRRDAFAEAMHEAGHPVADGLLVMDDGPSDRATGSRAGAALLGLDFGGDVALPDDDLCVYVFDGHPDFHPRYPETGEWRCPYERKPGSPFCAQCRAMVDLMTKRARVEGA